jgi:antitoxin (DNA-binding transcriptional repressor) of toxin-antitoxin stability system
LTSTVHEVNTHQSRHLVAVEGGGQVIIARGKKPIARPVPLEPGAIRPTRSQLGQTLERPVAIDTSVFASMTDEELSDFGL